MNKIDNQFQQGLRCFSKNPSPSERWILFHHAGGSALSYAQWSPHIPNHVECLMFDLPGRGLRSDEPFITQWPKLLTEISENITPFLNMPYKMLGHSLGGSIAYEVCQSLLSQQKPLPKHLYIAGRCSPNFSKTMQRHLRTDEELIEYIRSMKSTPEHVLNDKQLMQIFFPILKADFLLNHRYKPTLSPKLPIPTTVLAGIEEITDPTHFTDWALQTNKSFNFTTYPGNHFFIKKNYKEVIKLMSQTTLPYN